MTSLPEISFAERAKANGADSFVYKSIVEITLKGGAKLKEEIIAMKDTYLITLSNKRININDIVNIKKAN